MRKDIRTSLDLVNLTDAEGGVKAFLPPRSGIWKPPSIEIRDGRLVYPVPKNWASVVSSDIGAGCPGVVGFYDLAGWGWKHEAAASADNLLDAFVRLADAKDTRVKEFALRWGPLWHCTKHKDCVWQPGFFRPESRQRRNCEWVPEEPVDGFRRRADQVAAVLEICACLKNRKETTPKQWGRLIGGCDESKADREVQRMHLAGWVNAPPYGLEDVRLLVRWYDEPKAALEINTGLGFLRIAWTQVAQVITGSKGIYQCDDSTCGRWYITDRKPASGRKRFCPDCSKDKLGSKREWARRARNRIRGGRHERPRTLHQADGPDA